MAAGVKWKLSVKNIKVEPKKLADALVMEPKVATKIAAVGNSIVKRAKQRMGTSKIAPGKAEYPLIYGTYWSAAPSAVTKEIKFKDFQVWTIDYKSLRKVVGLVISNHPYSLAYERGGLGIIPNKFLTGAARDVIGKTPGVKRMYGL